MATPRYYITLDTIHENEVSKEEYVKTERLAGFYNTQGQPLEPATDSFSAAKNGLTLQGRIDYDGV